MLQYIKEDYRNPEEKNINFPILYRQLEKSLYQYIVDCYQSISYVLPEVKMTKHDFVIDVYKVNQSDYERTRSNRQKDIDQKYSYIKDSRLGELTMEFDVDMEWEGKHKPLHYRLKLLIPIPDRYGYYQIKGNKYMLQYQLTESSTYTTSTALVQKSLMPIKMRKKRMEAADDITGEVYQLNYIQVSVFDKFRSVFYFYFASMGYSNTLEFFSVGEYMQPTTDKTRDPDYVYFKMQGELYLKVKRRTLFNDYIRTIAGCIVESATGKLTVNDLENKSYWVERIGAMKTNASKEAFFELGRRYMILFNRMLDKTAIDSLRLENYNRNKIYAVIRWMIQNYSELWSKDNLDICNKRLRCYEYAAQLLNQTISDKIKRFVNITVNTEEKMIGKYKSLFSYRGDIILSILHSSGLLTYDESVNDMDFFSKLKITQKGMNASSNSNESKTISSKRRGLHPSQLGRQDINVCSAGDPGLTNYITPLCETDGLYFKGTLPEPESFYTEFRKELGDYDEEGNPVIIIDPVKYNRVLEAIEECHINRVVKQEEDES